MSKDNDKRALATRVIHAGQAPDPTTGAVVTPLYLTSTYEHTAPGEFASFRWNNWFAAR